MLKPRDEAGAPEPDSLGELFHRLVEDGKAYAQAEVNLYKTIGTEKLQAWKTPVILLAVAAFFAHVGALSFAATVFVAFAQIMNPALAGVVTTLLFLVVAAVVGKIGINKLKAPKP
ncbi:phage holin family protein [Sphingomonas ginkgonis]|uniref:Phage holin family protein n=1 Tax=Sphingomonas ginkgonis TaxID=2315330 RepID=A0A429VB15_9SPHN|nr:phage holin family protein [Sphingomonas ginkgonis]RST31017.1 phage holin family protein [Sphingomonas ginkgonis]